LGDGILDHQFFWYLQDIHHRFSMNDGHVWSIFPCCSFYYVIWSYYYFEVMSPALGSFFGNSIRLTLL
jgi:hypothetical protein